VSAQKAPEPYEASFRDAATAAPSRPKPPPVSTPAPPAFEKLSKADMKADIEFESEVNSIEGSYYD
jgi:hypothetical protein